MSQEETRPVGLLHTLDLETQTQQLLHGFHTLSGRDVSIWRRGDPLLFHGHIAAMTMTLVSDAGEPCRDARGRLMMAVVLQHTAQLDYAFSIWTRRARPRERGLPVVDRAVLGLPIQDFLGAVELPGDYVAIFTDDPPCVWLVHPPGEAHALGPVPEDNRSIEGEPGILQGRSPTFTWGELKASVERAAASGRRAPTLTGGDLVMLRPGSDHQAVWGPIVGWEFLPEGDAVAVQVAVRPMWSVPPFPDGCAPQAILKVQDADPLHAIRYPDPSDAPVGAKKLPGGALLYATKASLSIFVPPSLSPGPARI